MLKKINKTKEISRVIIIYAVFGCLWIFLSDTILNWFVKDADIITRFSMFKGSLFIFITSVLLYFLLARLSSRITLSTSALRESEQLLQFLVNNSSDTLVIINAERSQNYVSHGAKRIFGFLASELEGRPLDTIIHPDDFQAIEDAWEEAIRHPEKTFTVQYRHIHKDKNWIFVEAIAQSFFDEPAINGLIASVRDITERKRIEKEIQENEARYLSLFNSINSGVAIYRPVDNGEDFVFVNINEAAEKISLIKNKDVIGKRVLEISPNMEKTGLMSVLQQVYHTGIAVDMPEFKHIYRDGNKEGWRKNFIYKLPSGEVVAIYDDITERKRLEANLLQAQKMESIGNLAGGIAHDFNNILSVILGYAEMAKDDCQPGSSISKDLDEVLGAGNRAKGLVQQILAFSRQDDTQRIILQPARIVKEAITMLRPSLPTTIEITQDIDTVTGLVFADPSQLNQILMNLCTNAFHAMEDTGGKLHILLKEVILSNEDLVHEPDVTSGTFIQLSIGDSGTGIAPTVIDKIFDPYFTTKETGKGTGMGLSMVHGIVKNYRGFISLYSEPGEGTVFHVFLPAIENEALTESEINDQIPIGKERILFVDDEEILTTMGKTMLERLGYHVTARNSSLEAFETFQNQSDKFDLVITDQTMPGMTGSDLSRRMLQIRPELPIILCTGYSTIISEEKAKAMGIKEFVFKPLTKKDLAKLIRKVLDVS